MKEPGGFSAEDRLAASWIRKMGEEEVEALNALYSLYHRQLLSFFLAILRDERDAEEVLLDTYVKAYKGAKRYDAEAGAPFVWLATIGKRLAIDRLRRRRSRPDTLSNSREQPEDSADKDIGNVEELAHQRLEFRWIEDCLKGLSPSQREAIELAFFEGYTHHEISEKLGKPLGTVKSDIHRGLMHLRKAYLEGND